MLLNQVIIGDQTLFISWPEIRESWKFIDYVRNISNDIRTDFPNYAAGSAGPAAADELVGREGRRWVVAESRPYPDHNEESCGY